MQIIKSSSLRRCKGRRGWEGGGETVDSRWMLHLFYTSRAHVMHLAASMKSRWTAHDHLRCSSCRRVYFDHVNAAGCDVTREEGRATHVLALTVQLLLQLQESKFTKTHAMESQRPVRCPLIWRTRASFEAKDCYNMLLQVLPIASMSP
jgi:hypothetical protein